MAKAKTRAKKKSTAETIRALVNEELAPIREQASNELKEIMAERIAQLKAREKRPAILGVIELGDIVREKITGLEGVVIGKSQWLENCERLIVQPQGISKDGEPHKSHQFDIPSCELIEKGTFKKKLPETGGPAPRGIEASRG